MWNRRIVVTCAVALSGGYSWANTNHANMQCNPGWWKMFDSRDHRVASGVATRASAVVGHSGHAQTSWTNSSFWKILYELTQILKSQAKKKHLMKNLKSYSMKLKTTPLDLAQTPILRFHFPKHQNSGTHSPIYLFIYYVHSWPWCRTLCHHR